MNRKILFNITLVLLLCTFSIFTLMEGYTVKEPPFYYKIFEGGALLILFFVSSLILSKHPRRGRFGHLLFVGCILLFNGYGYNVINDLFSVIENPIVGWISASIKILGFGFILFASMELYLEITKDIKSVKKDNEKLRESVFIDALSGLYNRKYLDEFLSSEEFINNKEEYSVIVVDIDNFKSVNDTYGHTIGDRVIELCGSSILSSIRSDCKGVRYGGEEFVIITKCKFNIPEKIAKRVSNKFKTLTSQLNEINGKKTLSIGIASFNKEAEFFEIFDLADKALYKAKNTGKDKYVIDKSAKS